MDKHTRLLRKLVNYDRKMFYNIHPWWNYYAADVSLYTVFEMDTLGETTQI